MTRARNLANLGNKNAITADIGLFNIGIGSTQPTNYKLDVVGGNAYIGGGVTITGNLSVGGTVTYEDVTNVDSVGIITAAKGFRATAGGVVVTAGVSTFPVVAVSAGTTTKDLHVTGVSTVSGESTLGTVSITDYIYHAGDSNTMIRFPSADTFSIETAGSERIRVDSSGLVGIGTTIPASTLHVIKGASGGATANTDSSLILDNSSHTYVQFRTPATKEQGLLFGDDADNDAGAITYAHSSNHLGFRVNADEKLRIDSSGKVGIGITNPDGLLTIKGDSDATTTPSIRLLDGTDTREVSISNQSGDFIASVHGTDNATHSHIKMFESGIFQVSTGGASGTLTQRLRIGIGGTTRVLGTVAVPGNLFVSTNRNTASNNDVLGSLIFGDSEDNKPAFIRGVVDETYDGTTTDTPVRLEFHTTPNASGTSAERLRITSDGVLKLTGQTTVRETAGLTHHTNNNLYIRGGTTGLIMQSVDENEALVVQNTYITAVTNGSERLRIDSDGKVGINTVDARFNNGNSASGNQLYTNIPKFGVHGSIVIGNLSSTATDVRELAFYRRGGPTTGSPISTHKMGRVAWYGSSNDTAYPDKAYSIECIPDGGGWTAGANRKGSVTFNNYEKEVMRINSAGLVGIGTASPHIFSNLAYNLVLRTTGNTGMTIRSGSTSKGSILFAKNDNNTSNEGIFQYDHNDKAFIFNNYGGGAEKFIYKIQSNEKFRINSAGNVGIKTVAPQSTLDVWGCITITNDSTGIQFSDPLTKAEYHAFSMTTDMDLKYQTYNGSSWGARLKVNKEGAFYVGTENWPTGTIGNTEDRVMIGGGGDLTIWNEATAANGNVAKVRMGAKEGGDATKIGFSELRGGILNTSDQSGFFKMQVSDASGSGQTRFYTDESYMRYGTSSHSQYTGYAHQMSSTSANGDVLSLETPSNSAGADIALGFWARNSNSALIQMGKINFDAETTTANSTQKGAMYTYVNSAGSLKLRHQISSTGSPAWFSDGTGQLMFKTDSGTTNDNAGSGFYNVSSSTQGDRRAIAWFDADGGGTFGGSDYGMIEKQGGGPLKIYNYADTTGIWFYCNGNNVRATLDSVGNFQTRGYGAVKNVWNMMNIDPAGTGFNGISNNSDGGQTYWEIQNGTTIRLHSTSGGHSGQWNQEVHLEENGYYYWRASYRVTTTCGAIHPSTPTSNYKYPIQVDFRMGASGDAASCQVSLYQRFATTGTCNSNQVGTGSLENGTMVSLVGAVIYLPAGTYQPTYFTSGYAGVRELNVYKLELVQCGTSVPT